VIVEKYEGVKFDRIEPLGVAQDAEDDGIEFGGGLS